MKPSFIPGIPGIPGIPSKPSKLRGKRALLANLLYWTQAYRAIRHLRPDTLVVFNYHRIRSEADEKTDFDEGVFGPTQELLRLQMRWLKSNSEVISEEDILNHIRHQTKLPSSSVLITFDDGYRDNVELALPILTSEQIKAIFFIPTRSIEFRELGWWDLIAYLIKNSKVNSFQIMGKTFSISNLPSETIREIQGWMRRCKSDETRFLIKDLSKACQVPLPGENANSSELMTWDQIKHLSDSGMSIGSHTHTHRVLSTLSLSDQLEEFRVSKTLLESQLNRPIFSIAYPVGGTDDFFPESTLLPAQCGYELGFSFQTGFNRHGSLDPFNIRRISAESSIPLFCAAITIPSVFAKSRPSTPGLHMPEFLSG